MSWQLLIFIIIIAIIVAYVILYISKNVINNNTNDVINDNNTLKNGGRDRIKNLKKHPRSKSEAEVVKYLEEITGQKFPTVQPKWLSWKGKRLELDGYNERVGIALEFSGPLHTVWTPSFEPYEKYFERVVRDVVKVRLCKKHGVRLIKVDASLPSRHWRNYILSRLYDSGIIDTKPLEYILEQHKIPFRNPQLESELGLIAEMKAAEGV